MFRLENEGAFKELTSKLVLKDKDLLALQNRNPRIFNLSLLDRRRILKIIESDAKFLESHYLMDYSLLIAVEENVILSSKFSKDQLQSQHSINSLDDKLVSIKLEQRSSNDHRSSILAGKGHVL